MRKDFTTNDFAEVFIPDIINILHDAFSDELF
jgi:hypothetical protein